MKPNERSPFASFFFCNTLLTGLFFFAFVESIGALIRGADMLGHIEDLISFPLYPLILIGLKNQIGWVCPLICG